MHYCKKTNFHPVYIIAVFLFCLSCNKNSSILSETKADKSRVDLLLEQMTLEEKIGQMNQYNGFWDSTGPVPKAGDARKKYDDLKAGLVGAMLNVKGVENVKNLQELVVNESRLGIPLLFGFDVIHGHKTLSPIPLAESASWDMEAIERSARIAAIEASANGINWTFAPMVDISRDARWGRVMEGAGEDTYLACKIAEARVKGFQGENLSDENTIAATAKHFAGYGFVESGREYNTVDIGVSTLYNVVLPPFKACVDAGVATIMNSFNILNGIPATGDRFLQRDILKGQWGFEGFVVSDWWSTKELVNHGFAANESEAAVMAVNAGSDMDMESYAYLNYLADAVRNGKVDEDHIDDAVRRILNTKEALGLFDDPYKYCSRERADTLLYHEDHMKAALDMAKKSIVLLKNEGQLLPLDKTQEDLLVIGALAQDKNSPLGSWRVGSDDNTAISVLEGLKEMGIDFDYSRGPELSLGAESFYFELAINEDDPQGIEEAVEAAQNAKQIILVLGEHGYQSGEGRSRTRLDFPGLQQELMERVLEVNQNVVLLVMSGRPLNLSWADKNIPAILQCWQLGTQSGNAISQVLFGDYNPSAKLPMSFPRSVGQVPIYYNAHSTGRPGPSNAVFWSHYIDEANSPLYPFGHGLSYSSFEYSDLVIRNDYDSTKQIKISVRLKNTGDKKAKEVVQLYIQDLIASVARPIKELKGFKLVELDASQSKTIDFNISDNELGFFNNTGDFVIEAGRFRVFLGGSSVTVLESDFEIRGVANQ